ncbi:TetR/AcrR family transcriptional regulator [Actinoalloteichus spitiensis]|uniref:TetR/AcrR family transcriptional regulator n=1 Tax=Actinoalloteichus spitiensis TaxID=252394 RepID=UPI00068D10C4|nr:TetR/AcrR family transcriptional regulator [Actinoalloteichus spitiensis]
MGRLTRAETRQRNRARVLDAARTEFTDRGFRDAKIDSIAARADLTRGAVYSNFPGKRALYFAVLAQEAERAGRAVVTPGEAPSAPLGHASDPTVAARQALSAFARAWVGGLPLATDQRHAGARLSIDLLPEILADERARVPFAQLTKLDAILLGSALENLHPPGSPARDLLGLAETALTLLHGAGQLAATAPGFVEPFAVVRACERLPDLGLDRPVTTTSAPLPATLTDRPWAGPVGMDAVRGEPCRVDDGVVLVLGLHRLAAVEAAVRTAPAGSPVTVGVVTGEPAELGPLARLTVTRTGTLLRSSFPRTAWPRLRVICSGATALAAALGDDGVSDTTERAVLVRDGRVRAQADGFGAGQAVATAWTTVTNGAPGPSRRPGRR